MFESNSVAYASRAARSDDLVNMHKFYFTLELHSASCTLYRVATQKVCCKTSSAIQIQTCILFTMRLSSSSHKTIEMPWRAEWLLAGAELEMPLVFARRSFDNFRQLQSLRAFFTLTTITTNFPSVHTTKSSRESSSFLRRVVTPSYKTFSSWNQQHMVSANKWAIIRHPTLSRFWSTRILWLADFFARLKWWASGVVSARLEHDDFCSLNGGWSSTSTSSDQERCWASTDLVHERIAWNLVKPSTGLQPTTCRFSTNIYRALEPSFWDTIIFPYQSCDGMTNIGYLSQTAFQRN